MTTVVKRYPSFSIEIITEDSKHLIKYDTGTTLTQDDLEESLISFSIKNAMEDDSPVFSLVILAKDWWDMALVSNDLIRIKVNPDINGKAPGNPYIMVGLVSEIQKEGEYEDGMLLYRITGRAMTKALIDFEVGVIQEVSQVIGDMGWLPDRVEGGLEFSGNTASGIANQLMEKFIRDFAKYRFADDRGLMDFLEYSFDSWTDDEALADVQPFTNYDGSIRQFLEDVAEKPFNELFFDYTKDGKCIALMRPTPFDPDKWGELSTSAITSDFVVEESFGKSDAEMYTLFVVQATNIIEFTNVELGVFPKFHPDLVEKYGYKRMDVENKYLLAEGMGGLMDEFEFDGEFTEPDGEGASREGETIGPMPQYTQVVTFATQNDYFGNDALRTNTSKFIEVFMEQFTGMDARQAEEIVVNVARNSLTKKKYSEISITTGDPDVDREILEEREASGEKLERFTHKIFNWYADNANFYGGDIRVIGNPDYRIGARLIYTDYEQDTVWEFYVESVQHEFSYTDGYTTILGVTRGLPNNGEDRFTNLYGQAETFKGGYLGEKSLEDLWEEGRASMAPDMGGGQYTGPGGAGALGGVAGAAMQRAKQLTSVPSVYTWGGGRGSSTPLNANPTRVDCSSFVYWLYKENGVTFRGVQTQAIKVDSQLTKVSARGSMKELALSKAMAGDIIYFDLGGRLDGHMGIYIGNNKFIGAQSSTGIAEADLSSGYWWNGFKGHILRYNG